MSFSDGALIPKQIFSLYRLQHRPKYENIFKENMTLDFSVQKIQTLSFYIQLPAIFVFSAIRVLCCCAKFYNAIIRKLTACDYFKIIAPQSLRNLSKITNNIRKTNILPRFVLGTSRRK